MNLGVLNETSFNARIRFNNRIVKHPKNDKSFKIFCKITENGETVFEIRTLAGSSEHAKRIVDNWKNNATDIYPKIMKALNCEDEENN